MIGEISFENKKITLRNPDKFNIFEIDSISLLIGNNGSGKTKTLQEIIKSFKNHDDYHSSCNIFDINNIKLSKSDLGNIGVIYFSPLPFQSYTHENSNNFINASYDQLEKYDYEYLSEHKKVLNSFNINPQRIAKIHVNYKIVLRQIIDYIYEYEKENARYNSLNLVANKINEILTPLLLKKPSNKDKYSKKDRDFIAKLNTETDIAYIACEKIILNHFVYENDNYSVFCSLFMIEELMGKTKLSNKILSSIIHALSEGGFINEDANEDDNDNSLSGIKYKICELYRLIIENKKHIIKEEIKEIGSCFIYFDHHVLNKKIKSINKTTYEYLNSDFSDMSSGEMALLHQIITLDEKIKILKINSFKEILILIDEGDAFLHLEWQGKYIDMLNSLLSKIKKKYRISTLQIIIATHSAILATDIPRDYICSLDSKSNKISGFAAPLYQLLIESFNTKTIGNFSANKINEIIEKINNKKSLNRKDNYLINSIDNNFIRQEIDRLIKNPIRKGE